MQQARRSTSRCRSCRRLVRCRPGSADRLAARHRMVLQGRGGRAALARPVRRSPWTKTTDPQVLVESMGRVGLDAALTAISAVPIYGTIASARFGRAPAVPLMAAARRRPSPALGGIQRRDRTRTCTKPHDEVFPSFDWTRVFLPPFEEVPWKVGVAKGKGFVFGPLRDGETDFAWNSNFGCMPGTMRVAGQTQSIITQPNQVPPALVRYLRHPKGVTPREVAMDWRSTSRLRRLLPCLAQVVGSRAAVHAAGTPDVLPDVEATTAREELLGHFYASAWDVYADAGRLLKLPRSSSSQRRASSGARRPYICVDVRPRTTGNSACRSVAFAPTRSFTPDFKEGAAEKMARTHALGRDRYAAEEAPPDAVWRRTGAHPSLRAMRYAANPDRPPRVPPLRAIAACRGDPGGQGGRLRAGL